METTKNMNWKTFKEALIANPDLDLQFQYATNRRVDASYHITEIKQAPIVAVDCGGVMSSWTEVIVQLWEPTHQKQLRPMKVKKALDIVNLVEKSLPLNPSAIVKIEFGNSEFDTRQMLPKALFIEGENFVVDLRPDVTQCKEINRGGSCGTTATGEEYCAPASPEKTKLEMKNLASSESCTPGSGCC
jgi:ribosomal protein L11 methylase PrmA